MKRLSATLLAIGLVSSSAAFAQSTYYPSSGYQSNSYPTTSYPSNSGYNDQYQDGYRGSSGYQQGEASYDYARVIRVDPVIGSYRGTAAYGNQRCYESQSAGSYQRDGYYGNGNDAYRNDGYYGNDQYGRTQNSSQVGRNVATVVGGIAGAVLGSKIGGGTGSYAATAIGSMVGGMAGRQVYEQTQRNRYTPPGVVRVCDPEPVGRDGYSRVSDGRNGAYDVTYEYNNRRYTRRMDYNPGNRVRVRVDVTPQ